MAHSVKTARELALKLVVFLSDRPDLTARLLQGSGLGPQDLRQAITDPDTCISLLDFLLEDDSRVLEFAQHAGIRPQEVLTARTALSGPGSYGWEAD